MSAVDVFQKDLSILNWTGIFDTKAGDRGVGGYESEDKRGDKKQKCNICKVCCNKYFHFGLLTEQTRELPDIFQTAAVNGNENPLIASL